MEINEIKLKIQDENDLYSPYDPERMTISEDLISYFSKKYSHKHRRIKEKYRIHIISETAIDEVHMRKAFRENFRQEKDDINNDLKRLTIKEVGLGIFGVLALIVWLLVMGKVDSVSIEILSIIGWVGIWEATDIFIMDRPELIILKQNLESLEEMEIKVTVENPGE